MRFTKINRVRELLIPFYGKSFAEKIKFLWKLGWKANPVMTTCVVTLPFVIVYTFWEYNFHYTGDRHRKYNKCITIYRPDDPRVKNIQHYSILDK